MCFLNLFKLQTQKRPHQGVFSNTKLARGSTRNRAHKWSNIRLPMALIVARVVRARCAIAIRLVGPLSSATYWWLTIDSFVCQTLGHAAAEPDTPCTLCNCGPQKHCVVNAVSWAAVAVFVRADSARRRLQRRPTHSMRRKVSHAA